MGSVRSPKQASALMGRQGSCSIKRGVEMKACPSLDRSKFIIFCIFCAVQLVIDMLFVTIIFVTATVHGATMAGAAKTQTEEITQKAACCHGKARENIEEQSDEC